VAAGIRDDRSFNGATAMKPWKSCRQAADRRAGCRLQWGHGDEAVEEDFMTHGRTADAKASMGPRR